MIDMFSLESRVAVVTGARSGLGHAACVALAEAGADVVGVSRGPQEDTRAAVEARGRRYHQISADLGSLDPLDGILGESLAVFGRVDILVNNAGIITRKAMLDFEVEDWDPVMDLNLKSAFFLSRNFARHFVAQGDGGKIIHIASMLSFQGGIRVASYTASKHGILGLTRAMANEWAPLGINVNAIAPGYMVTDNTKALREDPVRTEEILKRIPAGRWGTPGDLAGAVVFLASKASNYVNGLALTVDGGWLAR